MGDTTANLRPQLAIYSQIIEYSIFCTSVVTEALESATKRRRKPTKLDKERRKGNSRFSGARRQSIGLIDGSSAHH